MANEVGIVISCAIVDAVGHATPLNAWMRWGRFTTADLWHDKGGRGDGSNPRRTTAQGAAGQDLDASHVIGLCLAAGLGSDGRRWLARCRSGRLPMQ